MRVPVEWLSEYADAGLPVGVLEERLTMTGTKIESVQVIDLSAIVVQAGAADRLVERDPAAARETLHAIRDQGRRTLAAMRTLVGIMREAADDEREPQPTLARLDDLVDGFRAAGLTIDTVVSGTNSNDMPTPCISCGQKMSQ